MSDDDQNYLAWMARVALAVLMVAVMFWIRGQIPDDQIPDAASSTDSTVLGSPAADSGANQTITAAVDNVVSHHIDMPGGSTNSEIGIVSRR